MEKQSLTSILQITHPVIMVLCFGGNTKWLLKE